jgi:hypothetical protein
MSADTIGTPPAEVAAVFARYPQRVQTRLHWMRALILDVAAKTPGVGPLQETLRWGEPAYVTAQTTSGSTPRMVLIPVDGAPNRESLHALRDCIAMTLTYHLRQ